MQEILRQEAGNTKARGRARCIGNGESTKEAGEGKRWKPTPGR
jgi:hypothetical protein